MLYEVSSVIRRYKEQREVIDNEIKSLESDISSLLKCRNDITHLLEVLESEVTNDNCNG